MIYVQQADIAYDSVDFDDPISTQSYFKKLFLSYLNTEEIEKYVNDMVMQISTKKTKEVSEKSVEVQAQHIMRSAAEKVHGAFQELKRDSIITTADFVALVMDEAIRSLIYAVYGDDDDDDSTEFNFQIRDRTKDAGVSKDYNVLG